MDLVARLERIPLSKFHYSLLAVTGLGWMFDAMDTGIIAFVLPQLAKVWSLDVQQMGLIGSMGLVGMAIGAVLAGTLADRIGRKVMFAATLVIYSVATGLCGLAWSYESLLFFRFMVGFGLGGQLPVAVTLVTEYSPPKERGRMIVFLESFWALGWLAAAVISYIIIPRYGWKIAFFIGSLPALYVFKIWQDVPESVRYLLSKNKYEKAELIVAQMEKQAGLTLSETKPIENYQPQKVQDKLSLFELFSTEFLSRTIMLWLLWFGLVYSYYGIFTWLPSLMVKQGYDMLKTFEYVLVMTLAQLPGYFAAAYLVDKIGRKKTMASFLALSALAAYFFGQGGSALTVMFWGSMMSFFNLGAWGVIYTYTPELYPTRIRALGSGWAAACGRVGGVLAPSAVGYFLSLGSTFQDIFTMFTLVMLAISFLVWTMGKETKGQSLDSISK